MSRRSFLAGLGLGAAAAALPDGAARAAASTGSGELATLLDLSKCVGCGACVEACREANTAKFPDPSRPFPKMFPPGVQAEDWSGKRGVDDRLTPYNWLFIQKARIERDGKVHEINIPRRCLHCVNPPCANLCPWGAAAKDANGSVAIDPQVCLGGAKCRSVCPWMIPQRQTGVGLYLRILPKFAGNGAMYKCDRCRYRLGRGGLPACIEACPSDVQKIGPREAMLAEAKELAENMNGYLYGERENGGANTFYVSPVPFDLLNAAVEQGPGRPHLAAVGDPFAKEENLAWAAVLAPLAGVAAGMLRAGRRATAALGGESRNTPIRLDLAARGAPSAADTTKPAMEADTEVGAKRKSRVWRISLLGSTIFALALTGAAQMPIFKRYHIADLPGLGWLDDFLFTHVLHYGFAIVLLFLLAKRAARSAAANGLIAGIASAGAMRALLWGLLIGTGLLRLAKNMPGIFLGPALVQSADLAHLASAVLLGVAALLPGRRRTRP